MKRNILFGLSLTALAGTAMAQQALNIPSKSVQPAHIAPYSGEATKPQTQFQTRAGGDVIFSDSFDGTATWTVGTSGQGTFILGDNTHPQVAGANQLGTYMGVMASSSALDGFAFFNGVQYLIGGSVDAQNTWVQSPVISFTGVTIAKLSFEQRYRAFNSDVTMVEYSEDGGATWTFSQVVNAAVPTNASAVQNTVSVYIPVNGSANGMIRFRWENTSEDDAFGSGYGWMVDDVEIIEGYDNDIQLGFTYSAIGAEVLQYTKIPVDQATAAGNVSFGAEFKNVGNNSQDVQLHVTSGSYDQTGLAVTAPFFAEDSVEIVTGDGMAIPTTAGAANFTYELVSNNTLDETGDDSAVIPFEVTDYVMAVDAYDGTSASMSGYFTSWQSPTGDQSIGTLFEIFSATDAGAVQVGIGNVGTSQQATYVGREFFVQIFEFDGVDFQYLDETPAHILAANEFGTLVSLNMDHLVHFEPGLHLVVVTTFAGAPIPVAFAGNSLKGSTIGIDNGDFVSLISDDATPNYVEAPVVRLNFEGNIGVKEKDLVTNVNIFPNPASETATVEYSLGNTSDVTIVVTDIAGKTVETITAGQVSAGTNSAELNVANYSNGIYNVVITSNESSVTKKFVKK